MPQRKANQNGAGTVRNTGCETMTATAVNHSLVQSGRRAAALPSSRLLRCERTRRRKATTKMRCVTSLQRAVTRAWAQ